MTTALPETPCVLLADDHPVMLCALQCALLSGRSVLSHLAVHSAKALLDAARNRRWDVIIADYSMPSPEHNDGWAMLVRLRRQQPNARILVHTAYDNPGLLLSLDRLGMHGILSKHDTASELLSAVKHLTARECYRSTRVRELLSAAKGSTTYAGLCSLRRREMEVTGLVLAGFGTTQIADLLSRSVQTASSHKCSAKRKLGVTNDAELFQLAFELGLLMRPSSSMISPQQADFQL